MANIALNNSGKTGLVLKDTNIYLWGEDQLSVSKVAAKFEENNDKFEIKTAHIEGEVADVAKVKALAKMPSRNELLAMLLQVWNAPITNFTIGLNALKNKKNLNKLNKRIKMAISKEDVLEYISNLSVLELSELVKEFEEKFGVSAAPVMVAGGAVAGGAVAAAEEKLNLISF